MRYSVRMRAAAGGDHMAGGRHISGAERIVTQEELAAVTGAMLARATTHSRGQADFIQITVEEISDEDICYLPLLSVKTVDCPDVASGRVSAKAALMAAGVSTVGAEAGITALTQLPDSLRGAMVLSADSGERLDHKGQRGIRVSRMDAAAGEELAAFLHGQGLDSIHIQEAVVLATKVAAATAVVAELCWSDDPEYTAGYVAAKDGYTRFPYLKEVGNGVGGRVFFVTPEADMAELIAYLERQPVLVTLAEMEKKV